MEFEVKDLVRGEMPGNVGVGTESGGEGEERECSADGDVETFGEAVHGYFYIGVGEVDGFLCEASEFGAKDEGSGLADVEVGDECVVGVRGGGHNTIAFVAEPLVGRGSVGVGVVIDPFGGAYGNVSGRVEGIVSFYDVDILHAEAVAGAEDGGGVVALVYVFENDRDMSGAEWSQAVEEVALVFGDEL